MTRELNRKVGTEELDNIYVRAYKAVCVRACVCACATHYTFENNIKITGVKIRWCGIDCGRDVAHLYSRGGGRKRQGKGGRVRGKEEGPGEGKKAQGKGGRGRRREEGSGEGRKRQGKGGRVRGREEGAGKGRKGQRKGGRGRGREEGAGKGRKGQGKAGRDRGREEGVPR